MLDLWLLIIIIIIGALAVIFVPIPFIGTIYLFALWLLSPLLGFEIDPESAWWIWVILTAVSIIRLLVIGALIVLAPIGLGVFIIFTVIGEIIILTTTSYLIASGGMDTIGAIIGLILSSLGSMGITKIKTSRKDEENCIHFMGQDLCKIELRKKN